MIKRRAARALGTLGASALFGFVAGCSSSEDSMPDLGTGAAAGAGGGAQAGTTSGPAGSPGSGGSAGNAVIGGSAGSAVMGGSAGSAATGGSGGSSGSAGTSAGLPGSAGQGGGSAGNGAAGSPGMAGSPGGAGMSGSGGMTPGLEACPTPPDGTPDAAVVAINTENEMRLAMGIDCAAIALPLCTSAQNHCDYYTQNQGTDCEADSPHDEIEGCPGYTGAGLGERFDAAGYMLRGGGSECMAFLDDPAAAAMTFINSVYHRPPML